MRHRAKTIEFGRLLMMDCPKHSLEHCLDDGTVWVDEPSHVPVSYRSTDKKAETGKCQRTKNNLQPMTK